MAIDARLIHSNSLLSAALFSKGEPHGDSVSVQKLSTGDPKYKAPKGLYFIYMHVASAGHLGVRQLFDPAPGPDLPGIKAAEKALYASAKAGNSHKTNFEDMVWRGPCWITMVIDNPGWEFYSENFHNHDPMIFRKSKEVIENGHPVPKEFHENWSFYDALKFVLDGGSGGRSAVRCINYFKFDQDGNDIGTGQSRNYCFELYLQVPFYTRGRTQKVTILIDPDGQNQGPPDLAPRPPGPPRKARKAKWLEWVDIIGD